MKARAPWARKIGVLVVLLALLLAGGGCGLARPPAAPPGTATAFAPATVAEGAATVGAPQPTSAPMADLLTLLRENPMPPRDYAALAGSLQGDGQPLPPVAHATPRPYSLGDQARFYVGNMEVPDTSQITATLRVQTERVQMWVEEGLPVPQEELEQSARVLEEQIYPTNHRYFGSEWIPGVDGDPHLVVLNTHFEGAVGYYTSAHEYPRAINPYSNEREMFFMNAQALRPGTDEYNSVLAHEFQHMIHWHLDSNEDTWVNEGASELAEELNGYGWPRSAGGQFEANPNLQLNTWPESGGLGAHYGAAYLFLRYFLDRFGPDQLRALVQHPANGLAGFDAVLQAEGLTGDDLFGDWLVANLLDDPALGDGRYGYPEIDLHVWPTRRVEAYPQTEQGQLRQYAADYVALLPAQARPLHITFVGSPEVKLVPNEPTSGHYQWWSNRGDVSHSSLERTFDLRGVDQATLSFNLWYDIEGGWDYAYVRASTDGGQTWRLLRGPRMTDYNPAGNALGPGYTGKSGRTPEDARGDPLWVREDLDLTPFCGGQMLLRFDYVTDDTVHGAGLCLDDLSISAIGFTDDVEAGAGEWRARGFIRGDNLLPQKYLAQMVEFGPDPPRVIRLPVAADGRGEWVIEGFGQEVQQAVLILSAITPFTTEQARYTLVLQ